jgi:hypothetical protein
LRRARREVAKVVQPAFANRDDLRLRGERRELLQRLRIELRSVMRMDARRATKALRIAADEVDRRPRARQRAPGDHHAGHAGSRSALDHFGAIGVETVVGEIDADVDERGGQWGESASRQPVLSFLP